MFEEGYVPPEALDEIQGRLFSPQSKEDFEAMFEDWRDTDLSGLQDVFGSTEEDH